MNNMENAAGTYRAGLEARKPGYIQAIEALRLKNKMGYANPEAEMVYGGSEEAAMPFDSMSPSLSKTGAFETPLQPVSPSLPTREKARLSFESLRPVPAQRQMQAASPAMQMPRMMQQEIPQMPGYFPAGQFSLNGQPTNFASDVSQIPTETLSSMVSTGDPNPNLFSPPMLESGMPTMPSLPPQEQMPGMPPQQEQGDVLDMLRRKLMQARVAEIGNNPLANKNRFMR